MKRLFLTLFVLVFSTFLDAVSQVLPNPGFEVWEPSGQEPPFDWEQPEGWTSSNSATEFVGAGVEKSMESHTGMYAASLRTLNIFDQDVPAVLVNGKATFSFETLTLNLDEAGSPIDYKPGSVSGFYKFSSSSRSDFAVALVFLKRYNPEKQGIDTVGSGFLQLALNEEFTAFEVPITDLIPELMPDSIIVAFLSSDPTAPKNGGVLLVDELSVGGVTGVSDYVAAPAGITVSPNPAGHEAVVSFGSAFIEEAELSVYGVDGTLALSVTVPAGSSRVSLPAARLSNGAYLVEVRGRTAFRARGKLIIQR